MNMIRSAHTNIITLRHTIFLAALIVITVAAVGMMTTFSSSAGSSGAGIFEMNRQTVSEMPGRSYTSIHIQEGDTLRSIAARYNDRRYCSDEKYIETIKIINKMNHEQLHPGCYLVVMNLF